MICDVNNLDQRTVELGRRGENLASTIRIDVSDWLFLWPDANVNIVVRRPGENDAYIAKTSVTDGVLSWPVTSADTAIAGYGTFEIRAISGEVVKKSVTVTTKVCECISCTGDPEPPEGCVDWVNEVIHAAERAEEAAEHAEEIAEALAGGGGDVDAGLFLPHVTEADNGKVMTVVDGKWAACDLPKYNGTYEVTPLANEETTLKTAQTFMDSDVTVKQIPYFQTSNTSDGETVYIGTEVEIYGD